MGLHVVISALCLDKVVIFTIKSGTLVQSLSRSQIYLSHRGLGELDEQEGDIPQSDVNLFAIYDNF